MAGSDNVFHVTDGEFKESVLGSDVPVLVDFWAEWCGPCRAIAPIFNDLADAYAGKVKFAKINVDENQQTPADFGVRGIPTLILFKDGKPLDQIVGAVPKAQLEGLVKKGL